MAQNTIVVTVRLSIQPEAVDDFVEAAQRLMVVPTQSAPGCIRYELLQDLDQPHRYEIIEEWESESTHADHLASDWLLLAMESLAPFAARPFEMQRLHSTG
jgi:quinol monooxygenase YgiN